MDTLHGSHFESPGKEMDRQISLGEVQGDSFRQLLDSQLASLERVLLDAHLKALHSVQARQTSKNAWGPTVSDSALPTKPEPPRNAWEPMVNEPLPQNPPCELFIEDEQRRSDGATNNSEKYLQIMPQASAPLSPLDAHSECLMIQSLEQKENNGQQRPSLPGEALNSLLLSADVPLETDKIETEKIALVPPSPRLSNHHDPFSHQRTTHILNQQMDSNRTMAASPIPNGPVVGEKFKLFDIWRQTVKTPQNTKKEVFRGANIRFNHRDMLLGHEDEDGYIEAMEKSEKFMVDHPHILEADVLISKILLLPNCFTRGCWDVLCLIFVSYDLVFLPLGFFELPETTFFTFMEWSTRLFWTFDIPMSLITGYLRQDGTIEMRPSRIFSRYLYTWFGLDVIIVVTDWFELISSGFGFARVTKASRTFRIIRMIRLLRLAKVQHLVALLIERVQSEALHTVVEMGQIVSVLLIVAHLVACIWWGVGSRDSEKTWVEFYGYATLSFADKYGMSLHWSVTQFTGGMDEVVAQNAYERFFAVAIWFLCFIQASLFLSSLTSSMTQLHIITNKQARQTQKLRRFLHQNGISGKTALRIQRNAQHALAEQQRFMPEKDVELLNMVSEPLRYELHYEMYSEVFNTHLFFDRYKKECPPVMRKICHYAFSLQLVSRGDVLFTAGEIPRRPKTYVFFEGAMRYVCIHGDSQVLASQEWITEAALWTTWMHQGNLTALADCRLYTLDAKMFREIVGQFEHLCFDPRTYAQAYIRDLNGLETEDLTDLSFHVERSGAERAVLKRGTQVYDLMKNVYGVKPGSAASRRGAAFVLSKFASSTGLGESGRSAALHRKATGAV